MGTQIWIYVINRDMGDGIPLLVLTGLVLDRLDPRTLTSLFSDNDNHLVLAGRLAGWLAGWLAGIPARTFPFIQ